MRINNNIAAMNTHRQYTINNNNVAKSVAKLSSGYRINSAADDAAGLAISEKMRAQIRGLTMASKNSNDGISLVQTAEGALQTTHDILQKMRELAVQSASDTNETTIDRSALNEEFQQLINELNDTADKAKFNDMGLIDGSYQSILRNVAAATGYASASNVELTNKAIGGTYTHTLTVKEETIAGTAVKGVVPDDYSSNIGGSSAIKSFVFADADFVQFADTATGNLAWTAADGDTLGVSSVTMNDAENKITMKLALSEVAGGDDGVFNFELNVFKNEDGTFSVEAVGIGGTTAFAGLEFEDDATFESIYDSLKALEGGAPVAMDNDEISLQAAQEFTVSYADGTIGAATGEYNGTYTLSFDDTASDGSAVTVSLKNSNGDVVSTTNLDLSAIAADEEYTFDLGVLGKVTITTGSDYDPGTSLNDYTDIIAALDGKTITVDGGVTAKAADKNVTATITTNAGEEINLVEGMTGYTTKDGITVNFDRAITADDLVSQASVEAFLGGNETSIVVSQKMGKDFVIQTGANQGDELAINIDRMDANSIGLGSSNISTRLTASLAITQVNDAINEVSTQRAALGALQNRLEYKIQNLDISAENLTAAESRIRDVDMAKEMTNFTKNNILSQAATAMLAQANSLPQNVLQLLG